MNRFERIRTAYSNLYAWAAYQFFSNDMFQPVITFIPGMEVVSTGVPKTLRVGSAVWDLHVIASKLDDWEDTNDWSSYFYEDLSWVALAFGEATIHSSGTAYMLDADFIRGWIKMLEGTILAISQNRNLNAQYARDNYWFIQQLAEIKYILEDAFIQED